MGYVLVSKYRRDMLDVHKLIEHPPSTWSKYIGVKDGYQSIIEMEMAELEQNHKDDDYHGYIENLIHVAAACIWAHNQMTCE